MILFLLVLLGLVLGSFIGAVTYRIPRGKQFIKGNSFCDNCKKDLKWYDNIPLFSFLFYKGRSRCCNKKISIRYPLTEVASAIGLIFLYINFGFGFMFIVYYTLFLLALSIFIIDFEHQIIPDELSWLILLLGFIFNNHVLTESLFSGFLFSNLFLFLYIVTLGRGMGLGDVKLAIPLAYWLGIKNGLTWFMLSFIIGGMFAFTLLLLKRVHLKTKIAFGPFMIIAFWITLFLNF